MKTKIRIFSTFLNLFRIRHYHMVWGNAEEDKWHQAQRDCLVDTPMQTRKLGMLPLNAL
jgi:hypothetical protein